MKTFSEIFSKYNPLDKDRNIVTLDLANPTPAVDIIMSMGQEQERDRIYNAVLELDVDSFDDIVYKADVLALIKGENK